MQFSKADLPALTKLFAQLQVCFSCRRVRFRQFVWMFREGGVKCHLCQNTICVSCSRQVLIKYKIFHTEISDFSPISQDTKQCHFSISNVSGNCFSVQNQIKFSLVFLSNFNEFHHFLCLFILYLSPLNFSVSLFCRQLHSQPFLTYLRSFLFRLWLAILTFSSYFPQSK